MVKISVCMIVRNEADNLDICLSNINGKVDEIIVVDTGSTDATAEIARKYTDKIFVFSWAGDFAEARNFAAAQAANEWIMVLEADEIVVEFDRYQIAAALSTATPDCIGVITLISEYEAETGLARSWENINRVYNRGLCHYAGYADEQIVRKDGGCSQSVLLPLLVEYSGYLAREFAAKDKAAGNFPLPAKAVDAAPGDAYLKYQIGRAYYTAKDYQEAACCFNEALEMIQDNAYGYEQDLVVSYGYALLKCGRYQEAAAIPAHYPFYGESADYLFMVGLVYMNNAQFAKAVDTFAKCTECKSPKIKGANSFLPFYNIGVIYECLGYFAQAAEYYRKCGEYAPASQRLKKLEAVS